MSFFLAKITITPIEVNDVCLLDIKALKQDTHCIISTQQCGLIWLYSFSPQKE